MKTKNICIVCKSEWDYSFFDRLMSFIFRTSLDFQTCGSCRAGSAMGLRAQELRDMNTYRTTFKCGIIVERLGKNTGECPQHGSECYKARIDIGKMKGFMEFI